MSRRTLVLAVLFAVYAGHLSGQVVINELHYDPPDNTEPEEFIELYNAGPATIDLSGWFFSSGIDFEFPANTSIGSGAFIIVAEDPTTLSANLGVVDALGPWEGRLKNDGERVVLRDADANIVDEVNYAASFPWPIAPAGRGGSMELIHPSLDNDLAGSWRASGQDDGPQVERRYFISANDASWRYRKGTSEASNPRGAWRLDGFAEDGTWNTGRTSLGYGDGDDNTTLSDMQGSYTSVFARHTFTIASAADIPTSIKLRAYSDDGCIVWVNGTEIGRFDVGGGDLAFNATANNHEAAWSEVVLGAPSTFLEVGTNVLAIQGFNQSLSSSDFSLDAELFVPGSEDADSFAFPSPGEVNSVFSPTAPPQIRQVEHTPLMPAGGEPAVITAKATDPDGVRSVHVVYQVVEPGDYIPAFLPLSSSTLLGDPNRDLERNPAFDAPANWTSVAMVDDGTGADAIAGDDVYSVQLPGRTHRTLIRYRVEVEDEGGSRLRVPYPDDRSQNFAYFVYDGVPNYVAETRSVIRTGFVHQAEDLERIPVYHLITRPGDLTQCYGYSSGDRIPKGNEDARDKFNWEGAFVYEGHVYDHIRYRLRQANDRYGGSGKRSMRFRFNKGNRFRARDNYGKRFPERWRTLNTGKGFDNKDVGNFGVTEAMNANLWNAMGVPAPWFFTFHLRVIDGEEEAPSGTNGQYFGDFWGTFSGIEDYDTRFVRGHDLEDGTLYKLKDGQFNGDELRRHQGVNAVTTDADFQNIRANLRPQRTVQWLNQHVNYEMWYRYHTVNEGIRHYDVQPADSHSKNRAWFFEPDYSGTPYGRLWTLPWDSDASWGPNWGSGVDYSKNAIYADGGKPTFKQGHRNTIREFRDLVWTREALEQRIDDLASFIDDLSHADRDRWRNAPSSAGSQDFGSLASKITSMKGFAFTGWSGGSGPTVPAGGRARHLENLANAEGDATSLPETPQIDYAGFAGFPLDSLLFLTSAFSDPQGDNTFAALAWRIGEVSDPDAPFDLTNPRKYEVPAIWESGELTTFDAEIRIPPEVIVAGTRYRVRAKMKDSSGRWSHWSDPVEFVASRPAGTFSVQDDLRITEVMYHPEDGSDLEFVEVHNIGSAPIDLSSVRFDDGIEFSFSEGAITELEPGAYAVVVNNTAVFEHRYGTDIPIAGEFDGRLDNSSESLRLVFGAAVIVQEFSYADGWHPSTDGLGRSLVVVDAAGDPSEWNIAAGWQPSGDVGGSPGAEDSASSGLGGLQRAGDSNQDGRIDVSDALSLLLKLFGGDATLPCEGELGSVGNTTVLDVDGDTEVNVTDAVALLSYLFTGGAPPALGDACVRVEGCASVCR